MEVFVCLAITALLWILASTIFLPFTILLVLSKTINDKWFSFLFTKLGSRMMPPEFSPMRRKLFKHLEDEHLSRRNKSVSLKVLEIGIGYGVNLDLYPENSRLTALDMNPSFIEYFNKNRKKYPQVELDGIVISYAEDMKEVDDGSFDLLICTHVLCSVKNVDSVMKEVKRVLKPEGKFLFIEHVAFPQSKEEYIVQKIANPLWATYFNGCYLDRDIARSIKKAGFKDVDYDVKYPTFIPLFARPHIFGIATK